MTKYTQKDFQKFYRDSQKVIKRINEKVNCKVRFLGWYIQVTDKRACHVTEYLDDAGGLCVHAVVL